MGPTGGPGERPPRSTTTAHHVCVLGTLWYRRRMLRFVPATPMRRLAVVVLVTAPVLASPALAIAQPAPRPSLSWMCGRLQTGVPEGTGQVTPSPRPCGPNEPPRRSETVAIAFRGCDLTVTVADLLVSSPARPRAAFRGTRERPRWIRRGELDIASFAPDTTMAIDDPTATELHQSLLVFERGGHVLRFDLVGSEEGDPRAATCRRAMASWSSAFARTFARGGPLVLPRRETVAFGGRRYSIPLGPGYGVIRDLEGFHGSVSSEIVRVEAFSSGGPRSWLRIVECPGDCPTDLAAPTVLSELPAFGQRWRLRPYQEGFEPALPGGPADWSASISEPVEAPDQGVVLFVEIAGTPAERRTLMDIARAATPAP